MKINNDKKTNSKTNYPTGIGNKVENKKNEGKKFTPEFDKIYQSIVTEYFDNNDLKNFMEVLYNQIYDSKNTDPQGVIQWARGHIYQSQFKFRLNR